MGAMLALIIEVTPGEAKIPREIRFRVEAADGARLAEASAGFQIGTPPSQNDPGEVMMVPFAVDSRTVQPCWPTSPEASPSPTGVTTYSKHGAPSWNTGHNSSRAEHE